MNPDLQRLQPYPFERLRHLLSDIQPPAGAEPINLSIGEPRHPTPVFLIDAMNASMAGLSNYPTTAGTPALRQAIGSWLERRYTPIKIDPERDVLPVAGSREALFSFAQCVIDRTRTALVIMPNPFYQIYEGAALLAGATPVPLPTTLENHFDLPFEAVAASTWQHVQLVYVCTPGNPTGRVMNLDQWRALFALSDKFNFVIASDECYSEIYFDAPPLGGLQAAALLGRSAFERLVVFGSLSKRSNAPGLRSGYVAGDRQLLAAFLRYRTYHGAALSPVVQAASIAAWNDEAHVIENRRVYAEKFDDVLPRLPAISRAYRPDAGFFLWLTAPGDDQTFVRNLYANCNVTVLPGSFLSRPSEGRDPGQGFVRVALVAPLPQVRIAMQHIAKFTQSCVR